MSDFPDPDEEFELMYADELELLREQENYDEPVPKSRRTLDFSTPLTSNTTASIQENTVPQTVSVDDDVFPVSSQTAENDCFVSHIEPPNNRKRSVQDLFGDIDDIQFDEVDEPRFKKPKNDKESDLALIDYIVELRKQHQQRQNVTALKIQYSSSNAARDKHNISLRVPKYPFIGVRRHDGERIYVRFHSEEYEREETQRILKDCSFNGVLGDSFKDVWNDARQLINSALDKDNPVTADIEIAAVQETDRHKQLWVDLYKPKKYLELLSDESTNRIMLRWMKLWDKVVFNRNPKIKPNKQEADPKNKFFKKLELSIKLDEHGRPEHKVTLLCGTPGLGKTTLAHMVARHAGYNVVEINASDDRSLSAFKTALENATQMRSVVDQEKRPNCLIFDEIDGAPQSSIEYLVKFITGSVTNKPKKGKAVKQNILKRPIICICNDVYVPALRPLRQIAFVVNFPQTASARLAQRLMEIGRREQIKTDLGAMLALAEKSNNDIRSCLSVLHFLKSQKKRVTLSDVYRTSVGEKDMQKSLFAVWQEVLHIQRSKVRQQTGSGQGDILKSRMQTVLQTITAFGDYERVAQGVFENYPDMKYRDSLLVGTCQAIEWFCFSDVMNKQIYTVQNYSLGSYLPYAFVMWHFVFASSEKPKLRYPSAAYEAVSKETRQKALITEVLRSMQPSVRCYCHSQSLILDILPLLSRIIVPPFRPVSFHLYTQEEKDSLLRVVKIMIDYSLNYIQERTPAGTYVYNLEPNIEEVITFNECDRKQLSYFNKQLIAREIETEKMRRFETPMPEDRPNKKNEGNMRDKKMEDTSQLPNHLQTLKAKLVKQKSVPSVRKDFFGRIIPNVTSSTGKSSSAFRNDIWFRYKEGYNNAVRKRVYISDLK